MVVSKNISEKFFRVENLKFIEFIIANSDITIELIEKAAIVARLSPYHNFGHAVGATMQGIRLAIAEGMSREQINYIAFTLLFHDAGHDGYIHLYNEMLSVYLMSQVVNENDTLIMGTDYAKVMEQVREYILETPFPIRHGKSNNPVVRIIQDADLAHLGQGPYYWVWASMGLVDEFSRNRPLTPQTFIQVEQEIFVQGLAKMSGTGKVFLSEGANKIFNNPLEDVKILKNWSPYAIQYAFDVRQNKEVTPDEFKGNIDRLNQAIQ